jgi:ATP-dependent RNA helicase RhlE
VSQRQERRDGQNDRGPVRNPLHTERADRPEGERAGERDGQQRRFRPRGPGNVGQHRNRVRRAG